MLENTETKTTPDELAEYVRQMQEPSGIGELALADLYAIMGACARDAQRWERKAARCKERWSREQNEYQAASYTKISDMVYKLIRNVKQEKGMGS